ncbi:hypothetical protein LL912_00965 [Niabella sp. CC-SYL272]|uniref:hypothetical protein n=1 Tax=Niabella agricola TaxID=2891571 RepID=UPI001F392E65|nr:hypothetical protein [Niabella agricola]MCF3107338.1 hypothetical protein [Niabella agricola]
MNYKGKRYTYNDIVRLKDTAESETFVQHLEILLQVVDDAMKEKGLNRDDFVFGDIGGSTLAVVEVKQH